MTYPYPFNNPYATLLNQQPNQLSYYQQSGFVSVQNEQEARAYPVQLGTSITFMDESGPYLYTKTMGRSSLDRPTFEKFRLVKETAPSATESTENAEKAPDVDLSVYALKSEYEALETKIEALQKEMAAIKERPKKKILKEVEVEDE